MGKEKLKNVVLQGGLDPKILLRNEDEVIKTATNMFKLLKIYLMFLI